MASTIKYLSPINNNPKPKKYDNHHPKISSIMIEYIQNIFSDYTLRTITIGTAVLGMTSGILGSFAVLRKQSLLGDAISHAALPGIALAFLISGSRETYILMAGALIFGLAGTLWIRSMVNKTRLKTDTALGLVLSVFFGFGMLLLTFIQKLPDANQAGLDKYLFGQAATLVEKDVTIMVAVTSVSLLVLFLFWKEFKVMTFDPDYTQTLGFNTKIIDYLITFFIVLVIVTGLQTVGVVLMSAMLLAPAAAARQWTNSLQKMIALAAVFGAISGVIGTAISTTQEHLPTGPVIVIVATIFVIFSILFSPVRGLFFKQMRIRKNRNNMEIRKTLQWMYDIVGHHDNISHPHAIKILNDFRGFSRKSLRELEIRNWIKLDRDAWSLTEEGYNEARNMYLKNNKNE